MAQYFWVYVSYDNGLTWSGIDIGPFVGEIPVILPTYTGRIICAYIESFLDGTVKKYNLKLIYSDNDGTNWSNPILIRELVDLSDIGIEQAFNNTIYLTYWKGRRKYLCWSYDNGETWKTENELQLP